MRAMVGYLRRTVKVTTGTGDQSCCGEPRLRPRGRGHAAGVTPFDECRAEPEAALAGFDLAPIDQELGSGVDAGTM